MHRSFHALRVRRRFISLPRVRTPDCRTSIIPSTIKVSWSPVAAASVGRKKLNFSQVFAGQAVGIKEVHDDIWLVSFMNYDLEYFDLETRVLEPLENPFGPKVLPM